ncbi:hypothetical protein AGMMS49574_03770 [Bacteroidia bacterium]|nr:hypothetical protein AGMMS49574_03770 [Bacteroidia bacterium]
MTKTTYKKGTTFYIAGKEYFMKGKMVQSKNLPKRSEPQYWEMRKKMKELVKNAGDDSCYYMLDADTYILYRMERYPCFDESDWDCENRYYKEFFFCFSLEEFEAKRVFLEARPYRTVGHLKKKYENLMCPFVYEDDGMETFDVYQKD